MWVCALETSSRYGEVAVLDPDGRCHERPFTTDLTHARDLIPTLKELLASLGKQPSDLDLLAVDCGPGSYTGIRVGVTAGKILAYALRKPVVPINSLDVLVRNAWPALRAAAGEFAPIESLAAPVLDAKMGQVYAGLFRLDPIEAIFIDFVGTVEELVPKLPPKTVVFGDGVRRYGAALAGFAAGPAAWERPRAAIVADLGARLFRAGGAVDAHALAPRYLRLSTAEQKLKERRPHAG